MLNVYMFRILNMQSLKERVAWALKRAGINQAELARRARVGRATVTLWLDGTTKTIEGDNLTRAADALDVNPRWLQTGEGPRDTKLHGTHVLNEPSAEYRSSAREHTALISALEQLPQDVQNNLRALILTLAKKQK